MEHEEGGKAAFDLAVFEYNKWIVHEKPNGSDSSCMFV